DCCLPRTSSPIAWGFAGQLLERRGERSLGSVAKLRRHRHDRPVGIAQHVHGLFEPMLAQPSMRRKPGAFLESTAEVEAGQAGIGSKCCKRDVSIAVRAQAFDRAAQSTGSQPAHGGLEGSWYAGMRSQDARSQEI